MRLIWASEAWDDYVWWQGEDKKTVKRINKLIKDIKSHGSMNLRVGGADASMIPIAWCIVSLMMPSKS